MKRALVIYPFIFGLFPVANLFVMNVLAARIYDALPIVAISACLVCVVLGVAYAVLKDLPRAGIIASGFILIFFSPYYFNLSLRGLLFQVHPPAAEYSLPIVYAFLFLALTAWIYYFSRNARGVAELTKILNVVSICLLIFPVWTITRVKLSEKVDWAGVRQWQELGSVRKTAPTAARSPDIYFIVMDRYAGNRTLKNVYGFDNRKFVDYLAAKDFHVADRSAANYPSTSQSLAGTLHLRYLHDLKAFADPNASSWRLTYSLLQDHEVARFLGKKGYRYIHMGSWWEPTRKNRFADENLQFTRVSEMAYSLIETSMWRPIATAYGVLDLRFDHWRGNRKQFEKLMKTVEVPGPKFVLAHFLLPHPPYVFDRDGGYVSPERRRHQSEEESYVDQLVYTNRMLMRAIDFILSKSKTPPVILLQADEGPYPLRFINRENTFDWGEATDAEINQKMKILNAFYLPGVNTDVLYPNISPVNTFRLVFNLYFNTDLQLLADESFVYRRHWHPYDLMNITSRLASD